ncbi:hypothetical protein L1887_57692 [Cichorium endivia]|nr:hypothetical protein L1887_57692 [Cichorium endivia]
MTADLVTVLAEGTFEEQIVEVSAFLSRSQAEASRNDFVQRFQQLALEAEPAAPAAAADAAEGAAASSSDPAKKKQTVQQLVSEVKSLGEGTDRELEGVYNLLASLITSTFGDDAAQSAQLLSTLVGAVSKGGRGGEEQREVSHPVQPVQQLACVVGAAPGHLQRAAGARGCQRRPGLPHLVAHRAAAVAVAVGDQQGVPVPAALHLRFISNGADGADTKQAAERTVAAALRLPKLYEFEELMQIKAVLGLNGTPVFELLKIFVGGNAKDFAAWKQANGAELARLGLDHDQLVHKMRLLDLADLCALSVSSDVAYADIAKTLEVGADEVEVWVIDVIRAGLVSGKLSQVNEAFRVYKSTHRQFGKAQWQQLEGASGAVGTRASPTSSTPSPPTRGGKLPDAVADTAVQA